MFDPGCYTLSRPLIDFKKIIITIIPGNNYDVSSRNCEK